jgi:hypothetical protein
VSESWAVGEQGAFPEKDLIGGELEEELEREYSSSAGN